MAVDWSIDGGIVEREWMWADMVGAVELGLNLAEIDVGLDVWRHCIRLLPTSYPSWPAPP